MLIALFLFSPASPLGASLPLTETLYLVPVSRVDIHFRDEVVLAGKDCRRDSLSLGVGVTSYMSVWVRFDYLTQGPFRIKKGEVGDLFIKGKFAIGDFFGGLFHLGFLLDFRFPTGKNAYSNEEWRNLSLGKNEIRLGPFCRIDVLEYLHIHLNAFYVFREGNNENFYNGFFFDITKEETWVKAFGFNPVQKGTFFNLSRLRNDYIVTSLALNTAVFYPLVPHFEIYKSFRITRDKIDTASVPIEGAKYNPFLLGCGFRFFFTRSIYIGAFTVQNPFVEPGYVRGIYGLELGMSF